MLETHKENMKSYKILKIFCLISNSFIKKTFFIEELLETLEKFPVT